MRRLARSLAAAVALRSARALARWRASSAGLAVGNQLDRNDCAQAQIAMAQAAQDPTGVGVTWHSSTGSYGTYTPVSAAFTQNGQACRQFHSTAVITGHAPVEDSGVTCRDAAGDWHRVT